MRKLGSVDDSEGRVTRAWRRYGTQANALVLQCSPVPKTNIRLARAGLGLAIVYQDQVREEIARGELVAVLEKFCEPFPGYYLFYPNRRHASPALRALIDYLRESRKPARSRKRPR